MKKFFVPCLAFILLLNTPAFAEAPSKPAATGYYNYANNEAEYSVQLPEAPSVTSIWAANDDTKKYMDDPVPIDAGSFLGETAIVHRVNVDTEDEYNLKITFLKARPDFLASLNDERIRDILEAKMKDVQMQDKTFHASSSKGPLKWISLSGFTFDKNHHPAYSAIHYLTGQQSILVIEVQYSIQDENFRNYYKQMVDNINYTAP